MMFYIGLDDTDSPKGMCTTYLATKICKAIKCVGLPRLIRLNPNIPYKTRGNGAVCIKANEDIAKDVALGYFHELSMSGEKNTNPAIVFVSGDEHIGLLQDFYKKAVSEHVEIAEAKELAEKIGAEYEIKNNGRGLIGALASIGFTGEKTYELIAYRQNNHLGTKRKISHDSVKRMDVRMFPRVFDSLDEEGSRPLIFPNGPDPILCGIRGLSEQDVSEAYSLIEINEPVEMVQIFETNQATDAHYRSKIIEDIKAYDCVKVGGVVSSLSKTIEGGHRIFELSDGSGSISVAAYKKSYTLHDVVSHLAIGDKIIVFGGISKYVKTINLEKLFVVSCVPLEKAEIPVCCGKNMTSTGKNRGYKCRKCGKKLSQNELKMDFKPRLISSGLYDCPSGARRHLAKPKYLMSQQDLDLG